MSKLDNYSGFRFEENGREGYRNYPEETPIYPSHMEFPLDDEMLSKTGTPLGIVVRPFIFNSLASLKSNKVINPLAQNAHDLTKCGNCGAYINPYSDFNNLRWYCALCSKRTFFSKGEARYRHIDPRLLPELKDSLVDFDLPVVDSKEGPLFTVPVAVRPLVHLFLIQENMGVDALQATIEAISAAVSGLHPDIHVVLMTYGDRIGLYEIASDSEPVLTQYIQFLNTTKDDILETSDVEINPLDITTLLPLQEIVDFSDFTSRIGDCKTGFINALTSILDALPDQEETVRPHDTLLATISSILSWTDPQSYNSKVEDSAPDHGENATFDFSRLWSLLGGQPEGQSSTKKTSFEKEYTGLILHVFLDRPQHGELIASKKVHEFDRRLESLTEQCVRQKISVNFWAVCSFHTHEVGLNYWSTLCSFTGGETYRFSLGVVPHDEKIRLQESLTRKLASRYATNCMFKLRTSSFLSIVPDSATGPMMLDPLDRQSGLYRVSMVNEDSSFGFRLQYENSANANPYNEEYEVNNKHIPYATFQFAFSYEVLHESEDILEDDSFSSENETQELSQYFNEVVNKLGFQLDQLPSTSVISGKYPPIFNPKDENSTENTDSQTMKDEPINQKLQAIFQNNVRKYGKHWIRSKSSYDRTKQLIVTKHLRVCTLAIPCTNNLNKLYRSCHVPTLTSLILREAYRPEFILDHQQINDVDEFIPTDSSSSPSEAYLSHKILKIIYSGQCHEFILVNWLIKIISHLLEEISKNNEENTKNGQPPLSQEEILRDILEDSIFSELLLNLLGSIVRTLTGTRVLENGNRSLSDEITVWKDMINRLNPLITYRLVHPLFKAMNNQLTNIHDSIPLRRDSMITVNTPCYLLDSGWELVYYKTLIKGQVNSLPNSDVVTPEDGISLCHSFLNTLISRLYEYPILPKLLIAESGTASASYFSDYLIEDVSNTAIDVKEFQDFIAQVIISLQN